jgi:hypothetical protein
MTPQHESFSNCPSAGRVMRGFLLSFLALADTSYAASSKSGILRDVTNIGNLPALGLGPVYPGSSDESKYERNHSFVCAGCTQI